MKYATKKNCLSIKLYKIVAYIYVLAPILMKAIFSIAFILFFFFGNANGIDSLMNEKDILQFLARVYHSKYPDRDNQKFKFKTFKSGMTNVCDSFTARFSINNWSKIDFNNDTKTDLFIRNLDYYVSSYVIIDNINGSFSLIEVPPYFTPFCNTAILLDDDLKASLLFVQEKKVFDSSINGLSNRLCIDTLVYKFGTFLEKNNYQQNTSIKSIFFNSSICFGNCPSFQLTIDSNRRARYLALNFNPTEGEYTSTISEKEFIEIFSLLKYLDMQNLKATYEIYATDQATSTLKVYYTNGTVKEIKDYGLQGTFGLTHLYKLLFNLRLSQAWKSYSR